MAKTSFTRAQTEQIAAIARHEVKHEMHSTIWNRAADHIINENIAACNKQVAHQEKIAAYRQALFDCEKYIRMNLDALNAVYGCDMSREADELDSDAQLRYLAEVCRWLRTA